MTDHLSSHQYNETSSTSTSTRSSAIAVPQVRRLQLRRSIKLKAATEMVEAAERNGPCAPAASSSNPLRQPRRRPSMIAASQRLGSSASPTPVQPSHPPKMMEAPRRPGPTITEPAADAACSAPASPRPSPSRLRPPLRLAQQYANPNNWKSHYNRTAPAIAADSPTSTSCSSAPGTTGTLMGCRPGSKSTAPPCASSPSTPPAPSPSHPRRPPQ